MVWGFYEYTHELMVTLIIMLSVVSAIRLIRAKTKDEKTEVVSLWLLGNIVFMLVLILYYFTEPIIKSYLHK